MSAEKKRHLNSVERIDKLLELVASVARMETKLTNFCASTREELLELRKEVQVTAVERSKIKTRLEQLELQRIEWKAEFDKWKWRLGAIVPMVTMIVTAVIIWILNHIWHIF